MYGRKCLKTSVFNPYNSPKKLHTHTPSLIYISFQKTQHSYKPRPTKPYIPRIIILNPSPRTKITAIIPSAGAPHSRALNKNFSKVQSHDYRFHNIFTSLYYILHYVTSRLDTGNIYVRQSAYLAIRDSSSHNIILFHFSSAATGATP